MTINAIGSNKPIEVAFGGTGRATLTNHGVLVGAGTAAITQLAVGANNSVLAGAAAADPVFSTTAAIHATSISFDTGSNTLANYVVGTWTPTLTGVTTAGTTTYSIQTGFYTRIGNMCFIEGVIVLSAATGTGNARIGNLPFTIKNQTNGDPVGNLIMSSTGWAWPASTTTIALQGVNNTITMLIYGFSSGVASSPVQMTNAANNLQFSIAYQI